MKYQATSIRHLVIFFFLIILTGLCLIQTNTVSAEEISLRTQPATLQIRATPPADILAPFIIENQSAKSRAFTIQMHPLEANGQITFTRDYASIKAEIVENKQAITSLTLAPKQKKNLLLHIALPQKTTMTDHAFAITFLSEAKTDLETEGIISNIQAGIAIPVLLSIEEKQQANISLTEFSTLLFQKHNTVPFILRLTNNENHFTTVYGEIFIKNMFGQNIGKVTVPKTNILAQTTREIANIMWKENLLIGLYSADLNLAVLKNEPLYHQTIYFLAFPMKHFFITILLIAVLFFLFVKIKRLLLKA